MLTPQLLFELYTYNYQRTLFEKLLNDKIRVHLASRFSSNAITWMARRICPYKSKPFGNPYNHLNSSLLRHSYRANIQKNRNFARLTLPKIDDAERVVDDLKKITKREDDAKFNFYDENHEFGPPPSDNEPNLRYFIELLNILDQELLADVSMIKIRRNWKPNIPIEARASSTPFCVIDNNLLFTEKKSV